VNLQSRVQAACELAKDYGSIAIVGLSLDEQREFQRVNSGEAVIFFYSGIVLLCTPESRYLLPTNFVDSKLEAFVPDAELMATFHEEFGDYASHRDYTEPTLEPLGP
jgi:hypothetical protein